MTAIIAAFGLDFDFRLDEVYKIEQMTRKNGQLVVATAGEKNAPRKMSLETPDSRLVVSDDLRFFYHARGIPPLETLTPLEPQNGDLNGGFAATSNAKNADTCVIILRKAAAKRLNTKSSAMVINLDSLPNTALKAAFLACKKQKKYIEDSR